MKNILLVVLALLPQSLFAADFTISVKSNVKMFRLKVNGIEVAQSKSGPGQMSSFYDDSGKIVALFGGDHLQTQSLDKEDILNSEITNRIYFTSSDCSGDLYFDIGAAPAQDSSYFADAANKSNVYTTQNGNVSYSSTYNINYDTGTHDCKIVSGSKLLTKYVRTYPQFDGNSIFQTVYE